LTTVRPLDMQDVTDPEPQELPLAEPAQLPMRRRRGLSAAEISRLVDIFGLFIAVSVLYWPSAVALNSEWGGSSALLHDGFLVLLVSLWLIVRERKRLAVAPLRPMPSALLAIAVLSFAWLWAWRAAIQEAHVELVPLLLFAAVIASVGWAAARIVAFPIAYLYFAMPIWIHINGLLQSLSARMTGFLLWIAGLPAYMQGNSIQLPWGTIHIAGGCSGLNTFVVGLTLSALYGKVATRSTRRRLIWLGIMGLLALIDNWVRIFVVTAVAYSTRMHSPLVRHHIWFGWLLFALTFAAFLWWAERSRISDGSKSDIEPSVMVGPSATARPRVANATMKAVTFAALAVLPLLSYGMDWARGGGNTPVRISWPAAATGWSGPESLRASIWAPRFLNASGESLMQYTEAGETVQVYAVAYRLQTQSAKLLGYWNNLLGNPGRLRALSHRTVASPAGRWRETLAVDSTGERSLIWSRYQIADRFFVDPRVAQLWYGLEALVRPPLASLTALRTLCKPDCRAAQSRIAAATAWARPTLQ
jgi:exosortase